MCILCGDRVNLIECTYDFYNLDFSLSSTHFIDGMCMVALSPIAITVSGATIHSFVMGLLMSGYLFCSFF